MRNSFQCNKIVHALKHRIGMCVFGGKKALRIKINIENLLNFLNYYQISLTFLP